MDVVIDATYESWVIFQLAVQYAIKGTWQLTVELLDIK